MATPPQQDPTDPYPYQFDEHEQPPNVYVGTPDEQRKWQQKKRNEEDDSLAESVLDELDEGLGCSNRLLGCAWQLITLLPRLVWKVISEIFD